MLKGIPAIISPDLIRILMNMGHGDELVLSDGNFPADSCAQRLIRCDGHTVVPLLEAMMKYFPLDHTVEQPYAVMALRAGEDTPPIWHTYQKIIERELGSFSGFEQVERFAFYERAKNAYAIVATSDMAIKGNLILKKGSVRN
jgi:L-fucose mutarotase